MILFSPIIFIIRNRSSHYFIPRIEYSPYRFPSLTFFIIFIIHIAILAILVKDSIHTTPILQFPRSIDFQRQSNIPSRLSRFKKSDLKKKDLPNFPIYRPPIMSKKRSFRNTRSKLKFTCARPGSQAMDLVNRNRKAAVEEWIQARLPDARSPATDHCNLINYQSCRPRGQTVA